MDRPAETITPRVDLEAIDRLFTVRGLRVFIPGGYGALGLRDVLRALDTAVAVDDGIGAVDPLITEAILIVLDDQRQALTCLHGCVLVSFLSQRRRAHETGRQSCKCYAAHCAQKRSTFCHKFPPFRPLLMQYTAVTEIYCKQVLPTAWHKNR